MRASAHDESLTIKPASTTRLQDVLAVAALICVGLLLTVASFRCIWNSDFWWQYSTGRLVAEQGIPQTDVLSYTRHGEEWIELRWLFCYGLYQLMQFAGPAAVILAQWLAMTAAFTLLMASQTSRQTLAVTTFVVMIAILGASQRFQCRPELVTFLMLAVFIWIIERIRRGHSRWVYALPILQIVWVNSHTVFILGPLVVGLWFIAESIERFLGRRTTGDLTEATHMSYVGRSAGATAATLLACLINPYGFLGLVFPFQLATQIHTTAFKQYISEFASTLEIAHTYFAVVFSEVLLAICVLSVLINLRRVNLFLLLVAVVTGYLAVTAVRNLPLFCLAAVPLIVRNVADSPLWHRRLPARCLPAGRAITCILVITGSLFTSWAMATDRFNIWQNDTNRFGLSIAPNRYPEDVARYLKENPPDGPLFNTMMEGSYLTAWKIPVFIDPRLEVYGEPFFKDYMRMLTEASEWEAAVEHHGFRAAVMNLTSILVGILHRDANWSLAYFDSVAAVFVHRELLAGRPVMDNVPAFEARLADIRAALPTPTPHSQTPWHRRVSSPYPAHDLAVFLFSVGQSALTEPLIDEAIQIEPTQAEFHRMRAALMDHLGRTDDAIASYERALALSPENPTIQGLLGRRYFSRNDFTRARPLIERSVAALPDNATNWALLARMYLAQHDLERALQGARQSIHYAPKNVLYRKDLAKIHAARGEIEPTIAAFQEAARMDPSDCTIWRDLIFVLAELGQTDRAKQFVSSVPQSCANEPQIVELRKRLTGAP